MADQKTATATATAPSSNKNQPARPPEPPPRRVVTGDTAAAAPATVTPETAPVAAPVAAPQSQRPTVFTPGTDTSIEALKLALNEVHGKAAEAPPPTELELAIEKVRELVKARVDGAPCPADKMTSEQKKAMFQTIFDIEARINAAKETIEAEGVKRTYAVLSLIAAYGGKMGKWSVNGVGLKARARGDSFFLVRPDQEEADII